jgi:hypothetical protein
MSRELDQLKHAIVEASKRQVADPVMPVHRTNPFFTFRYSSTEISSHGGNLSVKMRETRFEDGKLVAEECEGTLERNVYDNIIRDAQQRYMNQVGSFMKLFFMPFGGGNRRSDE